MKLSEYFAYKSKKQKEKELHQSIKLHTVGALSGMAIALEEDKNLGEVIKYGVLGALATLFFEIACPKSSEQLKKLL